jgi:beta propeller repeat protein
MNFINFAQMGTRHVSWPIALLAGVLLASCGGGGGEGVSAPVEQRRFIAAADTGGSEFSTGGEQASAPVAAPQVVAEAGTGGSALVKTAVAPAEALVVEAFPIATSAAFETSPRLGADKRGAFIVYTYQPLIDGALGRGHILSQHIKSLDVQPISDGRTDDQMGDVDGGNSIEGRIVYSAYDKEGSGAIRLFSNYVGDVVPVGPYRKSMTVSTGPVGEARIHGDHIVFVSGAAGATSIMYMNTAWIGTDIDPFPISNTQTAATNVEIGEKYAVWDETLGTDSYVVAYELASGTPRFFAADPNLQERRPATSGDWVVWEAKANDSTVTSIFARNLATNEVRTVANNGANNLHPAIDRDHIVFESDRDGDFDIYLYRIADGVTYQVTNSPGDQFLPSIHAEFVAWVDGQTGNRDVWVGKFTLTAPIADAGPDQAVTQIGTTVTLNGAGSYDVQGDEPLSYAWTLLERPALSAAVLNAADTATPSFIADVNGSYTIGLVVTDTLGAASARDTVTVSFNNLAPVANAGGNQAVVAVSTVTLDGSGSTDANLDALTYQWTLASAPPGSMASLSAPNSAVTTFVADAAGSYTIELRVSDGLLTSAPATVTVQAISAQQAVTQTLANSVAVINALPPTSGDQPVLKNANMRNALTQKINAVLADIGAGDYAAAYSKLSSDIIQKTDGCVLSGAADNNDWIRTCAEQAQLYSVLREVLAYLEPLR